MQLTDKEREITKSVISTYLLARQASSEVSLYRRYENPTAIERLVRLKILRTWDNPPVYLPTILAFENCGESNFLQSAKIAFDLVVRGVQALFRRDWDPNLSYSPRELLDAVDSSPFPPMQNQINLGLFLAQYFGQNILGGWTGGSQHTEISTFQISRYAIEIKDPDRLWADHVRDNSFDMVEPTKPFSFKEISSLKPESREVFVVHGHDREIKEAVARFLEKLDLTPIILHEQANKGRTIIEKFEAHSDVAFAVVLLTPDDVGRASQTKAPKAPLTPRARQNVILELGFFLGKLGRARVCALYKGNVEIPSDVDGVIYVPYDDHGAWRMALAKELKESGLAVDMNKIR